MSLTLFFYITRETALSFFVAFLFFFFIFFVNQILLLAEQILSKNAPFFDVLLLIFFSLPSVIALAAPFAALVGVLLAIGRLSSDNEIVIMRSSGLSYRIVYLPIIALGIIISLLSFFTNDVLLPAGTLEFGRVYRKLILSTPALQLESNSVKQLDNTVIVTGNLEENEISSVLILDTTESGEDRIIMASKARLVEGGRNYINLSLKDAFIHSEKAGQRGDYEYTVSESLDYSINQKEVMPPTASIGPKEMSSIDVAKEIDKKEANLWEKRRNKSKRLMNALLLAEPYWQSAALHDNARERQRSMEKLRNEMNGMDDILNDRNLRIYLLEFYKKFSIPFGALFLVFLATPVALFSKKSGQSFTFAFGLLISVLYWALLLGGQTFGVRLGYDPFISMWAPNAIVFSAGFILTLLKVLR